MKLLIVGGFLGSGKTTAINHAAAHLDSNGAKVGVITNDQNEKRADNPVVYANYSLAEIVINGTFSSNLDTLSDKIVRLHHDLQPDYLFAESVGSCTDLVATVLKPLMIFNDDIFESLTLTNIVDARMLLSFLKGDKLLFGDEVLYIFEKQIKEADLLILNKIDLLADEDFPLLKKLADKFLTDKPIISQNSFNPQNIENWLDTITNLPQQKRTSLEIDYQSYSKGESNLTWLEEELTFTAQNNDAAESAILFTDNLILDVNKKQLAIGHVSFRLLDGERTQEISFTAFDTKSFRQTFKPFSSNRVILKMNARIETSYETINDIIQNNIAALSINGVKVIKSTNSHVMPTPSNHSASSFRCCEECICLKKLLERNALRKSEGSDTALAQLEDENFECLGLCGECGEGDGCCC